MRYVKGNLLGVKYGIIGHQCNCQLVMGAGLAKQIRAAYPHVYDEYRTMGARLQPRQRLGKCQMVQAIPNQLFVANLFGQFHYLPRGVCHTDYTALGMALRNLQRWRMTFYSADFPVHLPRGMGCKLGGGQWNVVEGVIRDAIPDAIIVEYGCG